jgi:hypothetical protein
MNLLDTPALHLSANGYYVVHPGGVPVTEYTDPREAVRAYYALVIEAKRQETPDVT